MRLIGLAGAAGAGKDTLAGLLQRGHGWRPFSFSDSLYAEVSRAYGLSDTERLLFEPQNKERPTGRLALIWCRDDAFVRRMVEIHRHDPVVRFLCTDRSPRWILQRWGTDYRRAQDPDYWVRRAQEHYITVSQQAAAIRPPGMVNTSVRFDNEDAWLRSEGGVIVHVQRPGLSEESDYISERPRAVQPGDLVVHNDGTVEDLARKASGLVGELSGRARRLVHGDME